MIILYDDRPCGFGKTFSELLYAVQNRGLYLLAVDRVDAMEERVANIVALSRTYGKRPRVVTIKSGIVDEGIQCGGVCAIRTRAVTVQVQALPAMYDTGHVIAIITHEALKRSDLAGFTGWSLIIDETPSAFDQQRLRTTLTREFFAEHYDLVPHGSRSTLRAKSRATASDFRRDSLTEVLAVMHARVLSDRITVLTDLNSWSELRPDQDWVTWSIWSPEQLEAFTRVVILANAFGKSHTYSLFTRLWPNIEWRLVRRPAVMTYKPRTMTISYYAEGHRASRALFSSDVGKTRLRAIAEDIAHRVDPKLHIWTCNSKDLATLGAPLRDSTRLSPRQAGSNAYAHMNAATIIYTAKADPDERGLMRDLEIDPEVITATREFETLYQFASRISVRDATSEAATAIYVYDRAQADYLQEMFSATGYITSTLELIDLGFAHEARSSKPGPKPRSRPAKDKAIADEKRRIAARERKRRERQKAMSARCQTSKPLVSAKRASGKRRHWVALPASDILTPLVDKKPLLSGRAAEAMRLLQISSAAYEIRQEGSDMAVAFARKADLKRFLGRMRG